MQMLPRQPLLRMTTHAYLLLLSLILVPAKTNQSFSFRLDDILLSEPRPTPGRSIFFHETSCFDAKAEQHSLLNLSARQACAIESAALHNPNFQVFVLFADPKYRASPNGQSSGNQQPLVDAILSYGNVQLRRVNLWRYAAGTPVEEWLKNGQLFRSRFLVSHVSDFLRFVTLFRYGGLYLDLDVVVLQSMENVPPNYAGAESDYMLAAGIINLSATGIGHEIAELCLRDFQHSFNGHNWGNNGPGVVTRVAQRICDTDYVALMQDDRKRCMGLKVYWRGAFYAVSSRQWRDLFNPDRLEQTMARTKYSYVVHVWNKQSNKVPIKVGSSSAYAKLAERNCPRAYHAAGEYF